MTKSKLYTKTGDKGFTALIGGTRVPKNDIRLDAYGTVDELNANLGLLRSYIPKTASEQTIVRIQQYLFAIGAYLATDQQKVAASIDLQQLQTEIAFLENEIDTLDVSLAPLHQFIIPGENTMSAVCHVCRTICRRLERCLYATKEYFPIEEAILIYFNRLSDFLFVFSRFLSE